MTRYETPAFDPGVAFSWTLRSEEIARHRLQRPRDRQANRIRFESKVRSETEVWQPAERCATPAFAPGVAFSWTVRSAEIALLRSRPRLTLVSRSSPSRPLAATSGAH